MRNHTAVFGACLLIITFLWTLSSTAQRPFHYRPDAFPPVEEPAPKALNMASTVAEMADWDRYPTYETYLAMMEQWAEEFPTLCHVDTIGTSIQGRLILSMYIQPPTVDELYRPEFFYSSTIHGDEVTGYVMMLRLIDTLLHGYGSNPQYTDLINRTRISINPLANPDGTYYRGNHTVQGSRRYNANGVDLNRNYPDPFASTKEALQPENDSMIAYVSAHNFRLSANLHGGSEVMNYPWDCFTSASNPHPYADWWKDVCHRFVDTSRTYNSSHFRDVYESDDGVIAGGDWYVIHGGRQDYMNYYHNCLELTMEISTTKTLSTTRLNEYWDFLQHSLVNYIGEIHSRPESNGIDQHNTSGMGLCVYPNPAAERIVVNGLEPGMMIEVYDMTGRRVMQRQVNAQQTILDLTAWPIGIYLLRCGGLTARMVKK